MARVQQSKRQQSRVQSLVGNLGVITRGAFQRFIHAQSSDFYQLAGLTVFLVLFGLLMVMSSSSVDSVINGGGAFAVFIKQALGAVLGFLGLFVVSLLRVETIKKFIVGFTLVAIAGQGIALLSSLGHAVNGNRNWIRLGLLSIQPSEFLKLAMILIVASFIKSRQNDLDDSVGTWGMVGAFGAGFFVLVMAGQDAGTVIIMFFILLFLAILAGMPRIIAIGVVIFAATALPMALHTSASRWGRVMAWLYPNAPDPSGYNWQPTHATWAFAAGKIIGVGIGASKLKWSWIPEAENDFIFAIIGEETGLIGALLLIVLFIYMSVLLIRISTRTNDVFKRLVVLGVMLWILIQSMVNIAVVLTLLPVLGVPLPLISSGGSSLLALLMAIGVVLAIERENHELAGRRR